MDNTGEDNIMVKKFFLAGLAEMYTADERFKENIDRNGVGTAEFMSAAIEIYCK